MPDLNLERLNRLSKVNYGVDYNQGARLASGIERDLNGVSQQLYSREPNGAAAQLYTLFGGDARATNTTGRLSTPDTAGNSITGDIDVRVIAKFGTVSSYHALAAKWSAAPDLAWLLAADPTGRLFFQWSPDGTANPSVFTPVGVTVSNYRQAYRATLAVASGNVFLYRGPSIDGPWTQMGTGGVTPTSIFDSTQPVTLGNEATGAFPLVGSLDRFQLRNGIGGTIVSDLNLTNKTPGQTTYTDDVSGATWTRLADFTVVAN